MGQVQYDAARLVMRLTRSVSIESLTKEIGWLSLPDRGIFQKVVTLFKVKNDYAPDYLHNLLPLLVAERTNYNLRK